MLIYDDIRFKLNNMKPKLSDLRQALDLDKGQEEIAALEKQSAEPGFWDDPANSQKVLQRIKQLKDKAAHYAALTTMYEDVVTTIEMAEEMEDESLFPEVQEGFKRTEAELERQTLTTLLSGEYDANNAILSFHAGAGGTEAMDWTQMLVRMYQHWADAKGFKWKMLDELDGEDAGLKSAEMLIEGENAYGYLKSENGVHRLDYFAEAADSENGIDLGKLLGDALAVALREAARDDYLAEPALGFELRHFENGVDSLAFCGVYKSAGVNDNGVRAVGGGGERIARLVEQIQHLLAVNEIFCTAQRNKGNSSVHQKSP